MAKFEIIMPKLGESIIEATITKWLKKPGDTIQEDDSLAEIATDKVDSKFLRPLKANCWRFCSKKAKPCPLAKPSRSLRLKAMMSRMNRSRMKSRTLQ